jgi:hypothetical protein
MAYLLDTNVFIEAQKRHYGFDFCPAFWDWLDRENQTGQVISVDKVLDEIAAGGDDLADWARDRRSRMFLPIGAETLPHLTAVGNWVRAQSYSQAAINTFLQEADYYLVGRAMAHSDILVTHELPAPGSKHNVKIPDVCVGLGVRFMSPFQVLRTQHARFVLAT